LLAVKHLLQEVIQLHATAQHNKIKENAKKSLKKPIE